MARIHELDDGRIYVIRDIWNGPLWDKSTQLVRCEYAVLRDGKLTWTPCREGVAFDEIEPLNA